MCLKGIKVLEKRRFQEAYETVSKRLIDVQNKKANLANVGLQDETLDDEEDRLNRLLIILASMPPYLARHL